MSIHDFASALDHLEYPESAQSQQRLGQTSTVAHRRGLLSL